MAAKKTKKSTVKKTTTRTRSTQKTHFGMDHNFILIAGGGFIVLVLLFLVNGQLFNAKKDLVMDDVMVNEEKMMAKNTVVISDSSYAPTTTTVKVGDTVTFVNNDEIEHTATADDGSFDTDVLATGEKAEVMFDTPGTYTYRCSIHPSITGTIIVEE